MSFLLLSLYFYYTQIGSFHPICVFGICTGLDVQRGKKECHVQIQTQAGRETVPAFGFGELEKHFD